MVSNYSIPEAELWIATFRCNCCLYQTLKMCLTKDLGVFVIKFVGLVYY